MSDQSTQENVRRSGWVSPTTAPYMLIAIAVLLRFSPVAILGLLGQQSVYRPTVQSWVDFVGSPLVNIALATYVMGCVGLAILTKRSQPDLSKWPIKPEQD
ncbi:MAG: hypothetical protein GKR90_25690 [Pseudomonadales bacterium]|nr:hypothetical protein [Pseudomonadales bacterium]